MRGNHRTSKPTPNFSAFSHSPPPSSAASSARASHPPPPHASLHAHPLAPLPTASQPSSSPRRSTAAFAAHASPPITHHHQPSYHASPLSLSTYPAHAAAHAATHAASPLGHHHPAHHHRPRASSHHYYDDTDPLSSSSEMSPVHDPHITRRLTQPSPSFPSSFSATLPSLPPSVHHKLSSSSNSSSSARNGSGSPNQLAISIGNGRHHWRRTASDDEQQKQLGVHEANGGAGQHHDEQTLLGYGHARDDDDQERAASASSVLLITDGRRRSNSSSSALTQEQQQQLRSQHTRGLIKPSLLSSSFAFLSSCFSSLPLISSLSRYWSRSSSSSHSPAACNSLSRLSTAARYHPARPFLQRLFSALFFLCALVLLVRAVYHHYDDQHKARTYSIVVVLRAEVTHDTMAREPTRTALLLTALHSYARLIVGSNLHIYAPLSSSSALSSSSPPTSTSSSSALLASSSTDAAALASLIDSPTCIYLRSQFRGLACHTLPAVAACVHPVYHQPLMSCVMAAIDRDVLTDHVVLVNGGEWLLLAPHLSNVIDTAMQQQQPSSQSDDDAASRYFMVAERTIVPVSSALIEAMSVESASGQIGAAAAAADQSSSTTASTSSAAAPAPASSAHARILDLARTAGHRSDVRSVDLMIWQRSAHSSLMRSFPAFIYGVYRWDAWTLATMLLDDAVTTVDISDAVQLLELEPESSRAAAAFTSLSSPPSSASSKPGAAYNDQLVKSLSGNSFKIGEVSNAAYKLKLDVSLAPVSSPLTPDSTSPELASSSSLAALQPSAADTAAAASLTLVVNLNVSDTVLFTKHASADGYLVVLTVNTGYLTLALNWVCWARRIAFTHYLLLAEDQQSASKMRAHGCPVLVRADAPLVNQGAHYGTVEFQQTMTFRTEFLLSVLNAGFHFVTADMDTVWLDDPLPYLNERLDLQGQPHKQTKLSGGFVVVRATSYGLYFWQQVIECQRANERQLAVFVRTGEKYETATYTEQYCINELSHGLASQPMFTRGLLDPFLFPDGRSFFEHHASQLRGVAPVVIHNNWITGTVNKTNRMREWRLLSSDDEQEMCLPLPIIPPPIVMTQNNNDLPASATSATTAEPALRSSFSLLIRVLACSQPESLSRLLDSLNAADYAGDTVQLEINVDRMTDSPSTTTSTSSSTEVWQQMSRIVNGYEFEHGTVSVVMNEQAIGEEQQWLAGWSADDDQQVMLVLTEDVQLSPAYYLFLRDVIPTYYLNAGTQDAQLYGVSLSRPLLTLGESHTSLYGESLPDHQLPASTELFKYQLPTLTGAVFFPTHWRAFQQWYAPLRAAASDATYVPCVPTLVTNRWQREEQQAIAAAASASGPSASVRVTSPRWLLWWLRFIYEHGSYALHTRFTDNTAYATTATPYALHKMNDEIKRRHMLTKLRLNHTSLAFSASSTFSAPSAPHSTLSVPVYDLHMKLVRAPPTLLWRQQLYSPHHFIDQCWTLDRLEQTLRDQQRQAEQQKIDQINAKLQQQKDEQASAKAHAKQKADEAAAAAKLAKEQKNSLANSTASADTGSTGSTKPKKKSEAKAKSSSTASAAGKSKAKSTSTSQEQEQANSNNENGSTEGNSGSSSDTDKKNEQKKAKSKASPKPKPKPKPAADAADTADTAAALDSTPTAGSTPQAAPADAGAAAADPDAPASPVTADALATKPADDAPIQSE